MTSYRAGTAILLGSTAVAVGVTVCAMRARRPAVAAERRRCTPAWLSPRAMWIKLRIFGGMLGWAAENLAARLGGFRIHPSHNDSSSAG